MPRDMLYAFSMADQFMPELERMSLLRSLSHFQLHEQGIFVRECSQRSRLIDVSKLSDLLANLLNEATTIFPSSKYERLEFLGTLKSEFFAFVGESVVDGLTFLFEMFTGR